MGKEKTSDFWDVVIIGGGAAGLVASEETAKAGLRTLLVEARGRLGGRVYTVREPHFPLPLELGAEFIHGAPQNLLEIAHRAHLTYHDSSDDHAYGVDRQTHQGVPELVPLPHFWEDLSLVMKKAAEALPSGGSFADFQSQAENDPELKRFLPLAKSYIEGFHAADTRCISMRSLTALESDLSAPGERNVSRFTHGYSGVIEWMAGVARRNGAEIRLNTVVHRVRWSPDHVEISLTSRAGMRLPAIRARKAIITIPLSVLQESFHEDPVEGAIHFEPRLNEKIRPAHFLRMGAVMKILLRFRSRFWEKAESNAVWMHQRPDRLTFLHHSPDPRIAFPTWWTQRPIRVPLLTGWVGGPDALALANHTEESLVDSAIESFARISGFDRSEIENELESWSYHDWQKDPYSRGAYSYVAVGGEQARGELARPIENTLFFAGEALHLGGQSGTVDGAIDTGIRAAREVIDAAGFTKPAQRSA